MRQLVILFSLFILGAQVMAQKYETRKGELIFEASVPLFEDVYAKDNNNVTVLNTVNGKIASITMVKNFRFKNKLMEEHFNENYAETVKFPKATFVGEIENFNVSKLTSNPQQFTIKGTLNFHGVDHPVTSKSAIHMKDGKIYLKGGFVAKPANHNVKIPKMVSKKIAENVNVEYAFEFTKQ